MIGQGKMENFTNVSEKEIRSFINDEAEESSRVEVNSLSLLTLWPIGKQFHADKDKTFFIIFSTVQRYKFKLNFNWR